MEGAWRVAGGRREVMPASPHGARCCVLGGWVRLYALGSSDVMELDMCRMMMYHPIVFAFNSPLVGCFGAVSSICSRTGVCGGVRGRGWLREFM